MSAFRNHLQQETAVARKFLKY